MAAAKRSARGALKVIKGKTVPLSAAQQELMGIFAEHLRRLPEYKVDDYAAGWHSYAYAVVLRLLAMHFEAENPNWIRPKEGNRSVSDLPDGGEHFSFLMYNAANAKDPVIERRAALLKLAQDKQRVLRVAQWYEESRQELGLSRENILARKGTPLEIAAQASYEENQRERADA